ncbi:LysM peptidoglycan-binding domain-containing protein [Noviherbaspirillum cavernae]|uniref:LysM peptidoglycan-binding domain-containing protein n=1 Tax=Noviherbaspirillum cavernae TaxID=2320862 RepID=A0A418X0A9_9BURK|nr:peptidoglycan DD-metalloendopeptidase family protein [Noviherbaspirillum cavernae]RJG05882.1 LysM peptidoglycan-binding domain-containing protein [Noviherbaspirillum cavernae]
MKKARLVCIAILPGLIAACSTTRHSAPVVDRAAGAKTAEVPKTAPTALGAPKQMDGKGFYTVKKGDTLHQIAYEFGQNYRDLVAWNNLANPNDIKVDQVLRVSPPDQGAAGGVQVGSVAATSGVEVRPLSQTGVSANGSAPNKTAPRGEKRPYSDGTLAEMQKPEGAAGATPAATAKAEAPKLSDAKLAEKHSDPQSNAAVDDEGIAWIWPADGKVISHFSDGKKGIDIAGKLGQPVVAAGSGKVLYAGSGIRGYGNLVIVKHTNSLLSAYAHNKTIFVKEDQTVNKGQKIAEMGNSDTDAVKLHFEIRQQGKPVDPSKFLPNR